MASQRVPRARASTEPVGTAIVHDRIVRRELAKAVVVLAGLDLAVSRRHFPASAVRPSTSSTPAQRACDVAAARGDLAKSLATRVNYVARQIGMPAAPLRQDECREHLPSACTPETISADGPAFFKVAREILMGDNGGGPRGPRCIALVGPFQSGKTTLLEAILARTGAIQRQGTVGRGHDGRRRQQGSARPPDERRALRRRPPPSWATATPSSIVRARSSSSTTCAPRCRRSTPRSWCARRTRRKVPQLQLILRELEELKIPALPVPQQDRQGRQARARDAQAAAAGLARAAAAAPDPDLEGRASSPASSTSRSSAPSSTASTRRREIVPLEGDERSTARRKRASPCWRRSPTTTTS